MKIKNMNSPVSGRPVANQFIFIDDDKIVFQSYESVCCIINRNMQGANQIVLGRDWDYSTTTVKYLNAFLREYARMRNVNRKALEIAIKNKDIIYDENLY